MQNEMRKEEILDILKSYDPKPENILKALHELQQVHPKHYISEPIMETAAEYFKLTKGKIYGIVTYYSMFSLKPRGKYLIQLCKSPVCQMMGYKNMQQHIEKKWKLKPQQTTTDGLFTLKLVECLGLCGEAPAMMINKEVFDSLDTKKIDAIMMNLKNNKDI